MIADSNKILTKLREDRSIPPHSIKAGIVLRELCPHLYNKISGYCGVGKRLTVFDFGFIISTWCSVFSFVITGYNEKILFRFLDIDHIPTEQEYDNMTLTESKYKVESDTNYFFKQSRRKA